MVASVLLFLVPGLVIGFAARLRPTHALLSAPALTVGAVVVGSTLAPLTRVVWGYPTLLGVAILLAGILYAIVGRRIQSSTRSTTLTFAGIVSLGAVLIAVALVAWRCLVAFGEPGHISQSYDNVFHLNTLRYIIETGQASSLTIGGMTDQPYYPAGWHATVAAIGLGLGLDIPTAVNVVNTAIAAVCWPLSTVLLVRTVLPRSMVATVGAALGAASMGAFPLLMLDFGVLYPNLLAIATLPASVALTHCALTSARVMGMSSAKTQAAIVLALGAVVGTAGAHPTTFMAWLVFAVCLWLPRYVTRITHLVHSARTETSSGALRRTTALLAEGAVVAIVVGLLWWKVRPPADAAFWGPYTTPPRAVGELLLAGPMGLPAAWLIAVLVGFGFIAAVKGRMPVWVLLAFAAWAVIWVVVDGFQGGRFRDFISGVWYNDSYRVAALLPTVLLVPLAVGATEAVRFGRALLSRLAPRIAAGTSSGTQRPVLFRLLWALAVVAAFAVAQRGSVVQETVNAHKMYELTPQSALLSSDELALLDRLDTHVPAGTEVIGNPYTGAALSYALADRRNPQLHVIASISPALQDVYDHLNLVAQDPSVCSSLHTLNADYVLDFGTLEVHGENHTGAGMLGLGTASGLTLIDQQGDARLYRVSACSP